MTKKTRIDVCCRVFGWFLEENLRIFKEEINNIIDGDDNDVDSD